MKLIKYLTLLIIIFVNESSSKKKPYQTYQPTFEEIDSLFQIINSFSSNKTNLLTESNYSSDASPHICKAEDLLNNFFESLTPDDYEEGLRMDFNEKVENVSELTLRADRLENWTKNLSKIYEPILMRLQMRFTENIMTIDLADDCLKSLVRIGAAVQNQETWALQCNHLPLN